MARQFSHRFGYLGGLAVLYLKQGDFVFPIPRTVRTAPKPPLSGSRKSIVLTTVDARRSSSGTFRQNRTIRS